MQLATRFINPATAFINDRSGNVFMIFALSIFVIIGAAGAALDYSRIYSTKGRMVQLLDAAVLATGIEMVEGETNTQKLRAKFNDFFEANLAGNQKFAEAYRISSFSADTNSGEISVDAVAVVKPTFTGIFGYKEFEIGMDSTAVFDRKEVEVAVMLDVTGSMQGQKLRDLKLAARDLVDTLLPDANTRDVRISLVPYSGSVNAGRYKQNVVNGGIQVAGAGDVLAGIDQHGTSGNCVTERGGTYAATDEFYTVARIGDDVRTDVSGFNCPTDRSSIEPLTNQRSRLTRKIRDLRAGGVTAGHLGIAWSYYTLSEKWRDLWDGNSKPAVYSADTKKIAILMTDGEFNTYYYGTTEAGNPRSAFGGDNVGRSNALARDLCEDMKADKNGAPGITVYSVAFQAPASAEATLRSCANADTQSEQFYFSADNGAELRAAFRTIATSIGKLRISQ
ncbi:MAG: pilus assembly protein [Pseudomonadota bacterium]